MSFLSGGGRSLDGSDRDASPAREHAEERRTIRSTRLGAGTIACPRCDAPVRIGPWPLGLGTLLRCPFCDYDGPVRDFLSLDPPTRPTRVIVHVRRPARL